MKRTGPMWRRYLRFWGPDVEADVDEELEFHVEMSIQELVDDGWPLETARQEVRRRFGDERRVRKACVQIDRRREREVRRSVF